MAGDRAEARRFLSLASVIQVSVAAAQHKESAKAFAEMRDRLLKEAQDYGQHR